MPQLDSHVQNIIDALDALDIPAEIRPDWVLTQNRIVYWWWQVDDEDQYRDVLSVSRKWLERAKPVFDEYPGKFLNGASGLDYVGLAYIVTEE